MAALSPQKVAELKTFISLCRRDPSIVHRPELLFFKEYLESLHASIPPASGSGSGAGATERETEQAEPSEEVSEEEASSESDLGELDEQTLKDDAVIPPETTAPPPLAPVEERELTEEELDRLAKLKEEACSACEANNFELALEKYTAALQLGNPTALLYTRRADVLLKLDRPVACTRDCDQALALNPDNARAYKIRGKANRLLGKWREAHRDLDMGQKLDYDDALWDMQKLVDEKYKKIEEHERKLERRREEKERARREKEARRRRAAAQRAYDEQKKRESADTGSFPGGYPGGFPSFGMGGGFPGGAYGNPAAGGMPGCCGAGMPGGSGAGMPGGCGSGVHGSRAGGIHGGGIPGGAGGMPGGMGNLLGALNDPELKKLFENPKMMAAFQDIMSNPSAMSKYASDPEVMAAMGNLTSKFGGGVPGGQFAAGSQM
ncbi:hsp70 interacting protein hip [Cystoisospora suis]|uniref:Hsp70 interacting protein hip n=1 Tax=Cystoisospora suis TaxID=483139 RepID=A0A2C6L9Z9_9APIC|nr:hsp70 interacting protein hip [Cystoisospora suis]